MQHVKQHSPASLPVQHLQPGGLALQWRLISLAVQMYMSQQEVVDALQERAKIEPAFTQLVGCGQAIVLGWCGVCLFEWPGHLVCIQLKTCACCRDPT